MLYYVPNTSFSLAPLYNIFSTTRKYCTLFWEPRVLWYPALALRYSSVRSLTLQRLPVEISFSRLSLSPLKSAFRETHSLSPSENCPQWIEIAASVDDYQLTALTEFVFHEVPNGGLQTCNREIFRTGGSKFWCSTDFCDQR